MEKIKPIIAIAQENSNYYKKVKINFVDKKAVNDFSKKINFKISKRTDTIYFKS